MLKSLHNNQSAEKKILMESDLESPSFERLKRQFYGRKYFSYPNVLAKRKFKNLNIFPL